MIQGEHYVSSDQTLIADREIDICIPANQSARKKNIHFKGIRGWRAFFCKF